MATRVNVLVGGGGVPMSEQMTDTEETAGALLLDPEVPETT